MGVKIRSLLEIEPINFSILKGKLVAIDAANALYQFLSIIQPTTGLPLLDSKKRITSHLSGLFYRTINLIEKEIRPIYVFDGKPPKFKTQTIRERRAERESAYNQWKIAIEEGDIETARKFGQAAHRLTREMVEDSKKLLEAMGIPFVQAFTEGEAQASFMVRNKRAWAVASQDFDSLLFGAPIVVRNLSLAERRRIPRTNQYVKVEPERINIEENLQKLKISREQLIDIAILIGTDFNKGIKGVGAKTAFKLINTYKDLKTVIKEKSYEFERSEEELEEIKNFFLHPQITEEYKIEFKRSNNNLIKRLLIDEHQFSTDRVERGIKRLEKGYAIKQQKSLDKWFS
ncbi:MAG: flap endonuclease-1 [Candidatus Helarchaeota archaeon]|nr:flap endonuclease-1 [Candidatus Helarchaeota archaeon]